MKKSGKKENISLEYHLYRFFLKTFTDDLN